MSLSLPQSETLDLDLSADGWLTIAFNRPAARNALSHEMSTALTATLLAVRGERSVRGITFKGRGNIFCAGGDLKEFANALTPGPADEKRANIIAMNKAGGELFALVDTIPQFTLALIEGAAIAGGLGLACCVDNVAVTKDAKSSLTETQLGIIPAQIAPYVVRRFGICNARRLMLTGARFKGEEAKSLGLADHVAAGAEQLSNYEAQIRRQVLTCGPNANALTKHLLHEMETLSAEQMQAFAAEQFATAMTSEEAREGLSAFIAKRKPSWHPEGQGS